MSAPRPAADDRAPVWPIVERRVIMVEQYRFGADTLSLEFPAGVLESGEDLRLRLLPWPRFAA